MRADDATLTITNTNITASYEYGSGVEIRNNAEVTIIGGTIDSSRDIYGGDSTVTLQLGADDVGTTFLCGIRVEGTTLNAILAEGAAYWQNGMMITLTEDQTEIAGDDVTVLAEFEPILTASLSVEVNINGGNSNDRAFSCRVLLDDTSINGTYGDMFFANGVADISLKAGESVTAEGLPANVGYTVTT